MRVLRKGNENMEDAIQELEEKAKALLKINSDHGVPQEIFVMEECSELIKELTKKLRGKGNLMHIQEECYDVIATIFLLCKKIDIPFSEESVSRHIQEKIERALNRFQEGGEL